LLQAFELGSDSGPRVVELAREKGVLVNSPRVAVLRFMPALNVGRGAIEGVVGVVGG
jgi:acetylornithine/succinyldiaminopimelate/putrescine aminotransferase